MIHLVRKASDTPNITNKDDVKMIRYAYGGQDGVVKNYGSELNATFSTNTLKIGSGRVVLQGWEVDIDEAGFELTFPYAMSGTQYHTVYLEVNALTETATITSIYNSYASYPVVNPGDDLTQVPNGIAKLPLFEIDVYNGTITKTAKKIPTILYTKDKFSNILEEDGQTVKEATNVKNSINNVLLTDIFEEDKTTVKTATKLKAVEYGSADTYLEVKDAGLYAVIYQNTAGQLKTDIIGVSITGHVTYGIAKEKLDSNIDTNEGTYYVLISKQIGNELCIQINPEIKDKYNDKFEIIEAIRIADGFYYY